MQVYCFHYVSLGNIGHQLISIHKSLSNTLRLMSYNMYMYLVLSCRISNKQCIPEAIEKLHEIVITDLKQ